MNAIYATYRHALSLIRRDFWLLIAITLVLQFPAVLISEVHAHMPHRQISYFPIFLFGLLLNAVGDASILSLLNRSSNEEQWLKTIYRGVVAKTWPIVRVELNEFALEFVIFAPILLIVARLHLHNELALMAFVVIGILISNCKLAVGEVIVVRENCSGKAAVMRAWNLTSGLRFWYVAGCFIGWSVLSYVGYSAAVYFGPINTDVVLVRGIVAASFGTIQTVVTWCIYSHLILLEANLGEVADVIA